MSETAPRRRIYPQRLQYAFVRVGGEPEAEFRPLPLRLGAIMVGGFVLVLVGVAVCLFGLSEEDWEVIVLGLGVGGFGLFLGWATWGLWGQQILVCPGGLVRQRGRRVDCLLWADVKQVVQKKGSSSYHLVVHKGKDWSLDANQAQQFARLIDCLRRLTEKHSIPWKTQSDTSE